jgi:hypothetical protein
LSTFSADSLTELVQGWTYGTHANLGLLLKWAGSPAYDGDEFAAREDPSDPAPRLVVHHTFAAALPGDYNGDNKVDSADYTVWRDSLGSGNLQADGNGDSVVDDQDFQVWKQNFGTYSAGGGSQSVAAQVPEPSVLVLSALALGCAFVRRSRSSTRLRTSE